MAWETGTASTASARANSGVLPVTLGVFGSGAHHERVGAASHSITPPAAASSFTATLTTQYYLTTTAGAVGWIGPPSGWYNSGTVVAVGATATSGYQFQSFSGGLSGTATPQNVTMNGPVTVTANFQAQPTTPTTTIQSLPAGLEFTVDNLACVSPCLMQWIPGTSHTISAGTQVAGSNTQYLFQSWNQGTGATQTIAAPAVNFTYAAVFTAQYAVTAYTSPWAAGDVILTPAGGWYAAGTSVSVGATVNLGWAFTGLTGGVASAAAPQSLVVNGPVSLTASFTPDFTVSIPPTVTVPVNGTATFPVESENSSLRLSWAVSGIGVHRVWRQMHWQVLGMFVSNSAR